LISRWRFAVLGERNGETAKPLGVGILLLGALFVRVTSRAGKTRVQ
jgi:hypothetical protein